MDLVEHSKTNTADSDKICQAIKVVCDDGTIYSYSTEGVPDTKFSQIVSILSAYCKFPSKITEHIPPADLDEKKIVKENKSDDWFKPAGDL